MTVRIFSGDRAVSCIDADDRGLAYGDGLFETVLVDRGQPVWWDEHWRRLERGAGALGIACPDQAKVRGECDSVIAGSVRAVLKIQLTRGRGGRGYAASTELQPTWLVSLHASPPATPQNIALRWCTTMLAIQPALAGIKHCNRLEQVLARAEWQDPEIFDGLMCDTDGRVVCATSGNVFARIGGVWKTPGVHRCGIAGIAREWLLHRLESADECDLSPADVENADAVFLCNSVRGILPVRRLGNRDWSPDANIAAIRRQLAQDQPAFPHLES